MRRRKQHNTARDRKENSTTQKKRGWKAAPPSSSSPKKRVPSDTRTQTKPNAPSTKTQDTNKRKKQPKNQRQKSRILLIYCHSPDVFLTLTATQDVSSHPILTRTATLHKAVRTRTWREAEQTHEVCVLSEAPMVMEVSVSAIGTCPEFDRTDALRNAALPNCNQNCTREPCQTCRSIDDHSELSSRSRF